MFGPERPQLDELLDADGFPLPKPKYARGGRVEGPTGTILSGVISCSTPKPHEVPSLIAEMNSGAIVPRCGRENCSMTVANPGDDCGMHPDSPVPDWSGRFGLPDKRCICGGRSDYEYYCPAHPTPDGE